MPKRKTFENAMEQLEELISVLEGDADGTLSVDDALKMYKQGVQLCAFCQERLDSADEEVLKISQQGGKIIEEKFEAED